MKRDVFKLAKNQFDVLVIGGGINGAAVAHLAATKGLKVVLLEKGDFASGTSSKSTKLMHGGLRYLETFEFGLVRESLKERFIQLQQFPQLVKPLPFIIPVYTSSPRPLWLVKLGVFLYDFLSGKYLIEKHRALSIDEVCRLIPGIKKDGMLGGVMYFDARMDDAQLCKENIQQARDKGVQAFNHVEVEDFIKEKGRTVGVRAYDVLGKEAFEVRAKKIVCAAGPWTNLLLDKEEGKRPLGIRTTKGVHLICRGQISQKAVLLQVKKGKRIFFVIPWKGDTLIGTTDTDFQGNPDDVRVEEEDIAYLLNELKNFFPENTFSRTNIISSFAGLRPLVYQKGNPSKISRKHGIQTSDSGVIYVMGGKFTTYRKIAEDVMRFIGEVRRPHKRLLSSLYVHFANSCKMD